MKLIDYIESTQLREQTQVDQAKLLCFFYYKTKAIKIFSSKDIVEYFTEANLSISNCSFLMGKLVEKKIFKKTSSKPVAIEFTIVTEQQLKKDFGYLFDSEEIESSSELLDEKKFFSKYTFINHLIKEINSTYENSCYDATAVLIRRVLEISIILVYREFGLESEIRDKNGNYFLLDGLINKIKTNVTINLSRIKSKYHEFKDIGNYAAHKLDYLTSKKDIDDIYRDYRTALEELYHKGKLM